MFKRCVLGLALILGACTPQAGSITPTGFESDHYPYRVLSRSDGQLLPSDWLLDNYYEEQDPVYASKTSWQPKKGDDYVTTYRLDHNNDGEYDHSKDAPIYDLRFTHRGHDGVIFLRMIPLSTNQGMKRLSVLMDRYVEHLAGSSSSFSFDSGSASSSEKRYAAKILGQGDAHIADLYAYGATISVTNLDQLKVNPNAQGTKLQLFISHMEFLYHSENQGYAADYPVLMVVGYSNRQEEFDEGLKDFHGFVSRIAIRGHRGLQLTPSIAGSSKESAVPQEEPTPKESPDKEVPAPSASTKPEEGPEQKPETAQPAAPSPAAQ